MHNCDKEYFHLLIFIVYFLNLFNSYLFYLHSAEVAATGFHCCGTCSLM